MLISGLMFSGLHLSNHGATRIWLLRLFLQGVLLAYAVFRTGSLWWSVGYHTGWNWVSAPFFGAVGSGYLDEGHIFNFYPRGSAWVTGDSAGPEGSILAFAAVLAAFGLLLLTQRVTLSAPLRLLSKIERQGGLAPRPPFPKPLLKQTHRSNGELLSGNWCGLCVVSNYVHPAVGREITSSSSMRYDVTYSR